MATPPKKAKAKTANTSAGTDGFPTQKEIDELVHGLSAFMDDSRFERIRSFFIALSHRPPQVLLLEGGTEHERLDAAHYWSLLLNCEGIPAQAPAPCLRCPTCVRLLAHMHRDLIYLDGLAESIKIDMVRSIKGNLGEPPREAHYRIIILREAQSMAPPAANALLKSLEEPQASTSFLLLAPQRERLLPTLVSRSMVLTLPWPIGDDTASSTPALSQEKQSEATAWEDALCQFMQTGRGWFQRTGNRGAANAEAVYLVISLCRKGLAAALGDSTFSSKGLAQLFSHMPLDRLRFLDEVLAEAQESAIAGVSPATVLDWLGTRLYLLLPKR